MAHRLLNVDLVFDATKFERVMAHAAIGAREAHSILRYSLRLSLERTKARAFLDRLLDDAYARWGLKRPERPRGGHL